MKQQSFGLSDSYALFRLTPPSINAIRLFPLSQYINQTSEYRNLNTEHYWKGYPHDALPALTKWYCEFDESPSSSFLKLTLLLPVCRSRPNSLFVLTRSPRPVLEANASRVIQSGFNKLSYSTSKLDEKITLRCSHITSSRLYSFPSVMCLTLLESEMLFFARWISAISSYPYAFRVRYHIKLHD